MQTSLVSNRQTLSDGLIKIIPIGLSETPLKYFPISVLPILTENPVLNVDIAVKQDYLVKSLVELGMF